MSGIGYDNALFLLLSDRDRSMDNKGKSMSNILSVSWRAVPVSGVITAPFWVTNEKPIITTERTLNIEGRRYNLWPENQAEKTTAVWIRRIQ